MNRRKFLTSLVVGAPAAAASVVALPAIVENTGILASIKKWISYPEHATITLPGQNLAKGIIYDKPLIPNLKNYDYSNIYFDKEFMKNIKDEGIRLAAIRSRRPVYFDMKPRQFFQYKMMS